MIREMLLAAASVSVCSIDLTYDPHVAVLIWSDGFREEVSTINSNQCQCASLTLKRPNAHLIKSYCDHRSGFTPGWDKIKGYND